MNLVALRGLKIEVEQKNMEQKITKVTGVILSSPPSTGSSEPYAGGIHSNGLSPPLYGFLVLLLHGLLGVKLGLESSPRWKNRI